MTTYGMKTDMLDKNTLYTHLEQNQNKFSRDHHLHRRRLSNTSKTFDTGNARYRDALAIMNNNRGQNSIREAELIKVHKDNRHLVEKLTTMNTAPGRFRKLDHPDDPALYPHHRGTLNQYVRYTRARTIEAENKVIADRIMRRKGPEQLKEWEKDYQHHVRLTKRLAKTKHLKGIARLKSAPLPKYPLTSREVHQNHLTRIHSNFAKLGLLENVPVSLGSESTRSASRPASRAAARRPASRAAASRPVSRAAGSRPASKASSRGASRGGPRPPDTEFAFERGENGLYKEALSSLEQEMTVLPMHRNSKGVYRNPTQAQLDHQEAIKAKADDVAFLYEQYKEDEAEREFSESQMEALDEPPPRSYFPAPPPAPRPTQASFNASARLLGEKGIQN